MSTGAQTSRLAAGYSLIGAVLGFLGVAAGAFGAHALKSALAAPMMSAFETGVRYQLVHALALIVVGFVLERRPSRAVAAAGTLFVAGCVLFSGSLFAMALASAPAWGIVTPFGGACFLGGWACLAAGFAGRGAAR